MITFSFGAAPLPGRNRFWPVTVSLSPIRAAVGVTVLIAGSELAVALFVVYASAEPPVRAASQESLEHRAARRWGGSRRPPPTVTSVP
jgi:hypothetical protein